MKKGRAVKQSRKRRGGIYRIGDHWYIDYYFHGRRTREATDALTRDEAKKRRAVRLSDIEREQHFNLPVARQAVMMHDLCNEYMEHYAKVTKRSWQRDRSSIKHILGFFGNVPVERISRELCENFKKERATFVQRREWQKAKKMGRKPNDCNATVNRDMACLKKIFAWAVDLGKIKDNPARAVKRFKEPNKPFYVVSADEQQRLLVAAAGMTRARHLVPILVVALGTGMRLGEILNLEWEHVDFDTRTITVAKSKSGKVRSIPIEWGGVAEVLAELQSASKGGRYVFPAGDGEPIGSIKTGFIKARAEAGIPSKCRFHDLRHTFGSRCAQLGMDVMTIKELMGHSSVTTTMRYMHVGEDHKRRALREASQKWAENSDKIVKSHFDREARSSVSS
jgi:integrase